jgi:predicted Zn-ribbon and HTH transcriptional regulator
MDWKKFEKKFDEKLKQKFNGEYVRVGKYEGNNKKIQFKHTVCNKLSLISPHEITRKETKTPCHFCYHTKTPTKEQFQFKLKQKVSDEYSLIGDFKNMSTSVCLKHNKCNHIWDVVPHYFLKGGVRCPRCQGKYNFTPDEVKKEIKDLTNGEYTVLSDYKNEKIKILLRHNVCKHEWMVTRKNFVNNNTRCPICQSSFNISRMEEFLIKEFNRLKVEYVKDLSFDKLIGKKKKLIFDFYLPNYELLIECDGQLHFKTFHKSKASLTKLKNQRVNDLKKNEWCLKNKVKFVRFHYKMKYSEIRKFIKGVVDKNKEKRSTTIEKNVLLFISKKSKKVCNLTEYYEQFE